MLFNGDFFFFSKISAYISFIYTPEALQKCFILVHFCFHHCLATVGHSYVLVSRIDNNCRQNKILKHCHHKQRQPRCQKSFYFNLYIFHIFINCSCVICIISTHVRCNRKRRLRWSDRIKKIVLYKKKKFPSPFFLTFVHYHGTKK